MNLQNLSIIFIIIAIPIILVTSYYISLQTDTIKIQTSYDSKLISSAKEAIKAFETNTVEWNEELSRTADSKRRYIMASINTFTTSFANNTGMTGATKETLLPYIPAIAFTMYDGYYIYSPSETKEVVKDDNGLTKFEDGKIIYKTASGSETTNINEADTTYSHVLKPFIPYSARYKTENIDVVINYTLDNYIMIYGMVNGDNIIKSGYLVEDESLIEPKTETLTETIAWKRENEEKYTEKEYTYVYAEDNTKVYFDGNTAFSVSPNNIRTDLTSKKDITYRRLAIEDPSSENGYKYVYQALCGRKLEDNKEIVQGKWYNSKNNSDDLYNDGNGNGIGIKKDVSAINYYIETKEFNKWVDDSKLSNLVTGDIKIPGGVNSSEINKTNEEIFGDYTETSVFNQHKREVIKQTIINNLNQAITSYSHNSEAKGEYKLPILKETDWDQILANVSLIAFVQDIPIGMKTYNNYVIATSDANKEYVNPDDIYLSRKNDDDYYHLPGCKELKGDNIIGYRNTDYAVKSYYPEENNKDKIEYYYKHQDIANQECYYCLVQRELFEKAEGNNLDNQQKAYETALARERYISHEFR